MVPLYNLYFIVGFIIFVPLTESFNVFLLDKKGHIVELEKPIHIDAENTPKDMRVRLQKQLEDFLYKRLHQVNNKRDKMRTELNSSSLGNKPSPVVFSHGRYTLDFDNIDITEVTAVTRKPDNRLYDPNESFRDYDDFVNDRLLSPKIAKVYNKNIRSKKDFAYRKHSKLLLEGKKHANPDINNPESINDLDIKKKDFKRSFKRFKIVGNSNKKKKHKRSHKKSKKKKKTKKFSSEEVSAPKKYSFESLSEEKVKKDSYESAASDDDSFYLQGNALVKFNKNAGSDDGRRRLPYFMPKRFHWTPKDIKHLGYFWFNGPKGKYPEPIPLR